jgi:hypothetical protein
VIFGVEINPDYARTAKSTISDSRVRIFEGDFFQLDWSVVLEQSKGPWLIIGNPPWITSSALSVLSSTNMPEKENRQKFSGVEAITGKSNFDISEWMLLRYMEWLKGKEFAIAVLCKVTVARKLLAFAWASGIDLVESRIYHIDAELHFDVSVDACLFIIRSGGGIFSHECALYKNLDAEHPSNIISFIDGKIIKNPSDFRRGRHLLGTDSNYQWRSGIKHDCARVMELNVTEHGYLNGFDEAVDIEDDFLYPMMKSSDLTSPRRKIRKMVVPQHFPGEDVSHIATVAPKTWEYLNKHRDLLRKRGSSIYKNKGDFAIFGVGPYSFAPWKVAISGFYKNLTFTKVGPVDGRPVVFDDTVYFVPCYSDDEAAFVSKLLSSGVTNRLLESMVHWEAKRPITADLLRQIDLAHVAAELDCSYEYEIHIAIADKPLSSLNGFGLFKAS